MSMMDAVPNTHYPAFSNKFAHYLHRLGNILVWLCHWGFDQIMRFMDPIVRGRSRDMDQFPLPLELPIKVGRLVLGTVAFVTGIPLAILGQAIKVPTAYFWKQDFQYYQNPAPRLRLHFSKETDSLQIKTWNLAMMHSGLRRLNGTRPNTPRLEDTIEYLRQQEDDIVFFQEVFTEHATKMLVEGLQDKYPYIVHNIGKNVLGTNGGCFAGSKFPIDHIEYKGFDAREGETLGFNRFAQKGVLGLIVTTPDNKKIVLTNSHFDANGETSPRSEGQEIKLLQLAEVNEMRDKLEAMVKEHNASFVSVGSGDYNLNSKKLVNNQNEPVIKSFLTQYNIDPYEVQKTGVSKRILSWEEVNDKTFDNGKSGGDFNKARIMDDNGDTTPYIPCEQEVVIGEHPDTLDDSDHFPTTLKLRFQKN